MANSTNMLQLCRLCLVKDDVNIPIFEEQGDIRQIFLKISSCLPVKVSREDRLPKKICDGCSYKLDMLYEFWNTSANAEKQLLSWLGEAGVSSKMADGAISAMAQQMKPTEAFVKEETLEPADLHAAADEDEKEYLFEQQKVEESASAGPSATVTSNEEDEPPPKRARRTAAVKAAIAMDQDSDDDDDSGEPLTKVEDESEDSDGEDHVPAFVDVPSTSADDQPGPSGVGKDGVEAPIYGGHHYFMRNTRNTTSKMSSGDTDAEIDVDYKPVIKPEKKEEKLTKQILELVMSTRKKLYNPHKKWPCKICGHILSTKRKLVSHRKQEHTRTEEQEHTYKFDELQELYVCNTCSAEYIEKDEIEKHVTAHEEQFECTKCDKKFRKAYDFGTHNSIHDPQKRFNCPLCTYTTLKRTGFLVHINYTHLKKFGYVCESCGKGFNDVVLYKEHNNEHLGIKPFSCIVCSKTFTYSRYLLTHQVRSHRVGIDGQLLPNQCHVCSKVFSKAATLERHVQQRHVRHQLPHVKRHLCDTCGKGFAQKNKLRVHYRVHTGYKPYACTYCSKSFTKRDYLVMHERVHSGEKPYSCEYCGKSFSQGAPLRIHLRTHTGERPYVCQFCSAGFTSRGSLNMHCKNCPGLTY